LNADDASPASAASAQTAAAGDPAKALADARTRAEAALARADLAAYRGWIKFLRYEADAAASRQGTASQETAEKTQRLDDWVARITANPRLLATLSGVQEWAYESPVDGSGQPFKMAIPTDYDPTRPPALSVYMHGYSGNHLEHSTGMAAHPGSFDLAVLGRGGGYRGLSEADVLHVIDYVQAHWTIDPDRINLNGGSMGGGGTYRLGSRYPHRWASGRPTCDYASNLPVANLITLPIYATHSDDDWTVSVLHDRGPLARLRELGGQAILDETTGYGHAVWNYKEGNQRGDA
jgi:predicted peptidase